MSKVKFDAVKEHIKAKRYDAARAVLKTIDDPKAREWEAKLDALAPLPKVSQRTGWRRGCLIAAGAGIAALVGIYFLGGGPARTAQAQATRTAIAAAQVVTQNAEATNIALTPPTETATVTETELPTATATITVTAVPSATPTASSTPSIEDVAKQTIESVIGDGKVERISIITLGSPKLLAMDYPMPESFSGYAVDYTGRQMLKMACSLYQAGFTGYRYQFSAMVDLVNTTNGQTFRDDGLTVQIESDTVATWNCDNTGLMDPPFAVDNYELNAVLR